MKNKAEMNSEIQPKHSLNLGARTCPQCGQKSMCDSTVQEGTSTIRYRKCNNPACSHRFKTVESG